MAVHVDPRDDRLSFDRQQMFAGQHDLPVRIDDFQPFDHQTGAYPPGESRLSWTVSRTCIVPPIHTGRMNRTRSYP